MLPGVKKARPNRKHHLAILIIHLTKQRDICGGQGLSCMQAAFVRSVLYISEGSVSHLSTIRSANTVYFLKA